MRSQHKFRTTKEAPPMSLLEHARRWRTNAAPLSAIMPASALGALVLALFVLGAPSVADTQLTDPDIRNIRPVVMLLVDTSGSMERVAGASDAALPQCGGTSLATNERNRWTTVLEALTGGWDDSDYYCTARARTDSLEADFNYYLDYHEPPLSVAQNSNGVLDAYIDRVKFGLMTFDSTYTFTDTHPLLVDSATFAGRHPTSNQGANGGWSYGEPQTLSFPDCTTDFTVDSGARNGLSTAGALVSVGNDTDDYRFINATIQNELLQVRPFGGTPTAALLQDFDYYLNTHPDVTSSDSFSECRNKIAILVTDGQPDDDFRSARFNCDAVGGCPYRLPTEIAADLCNVGGSGTCTGDLDALFVVAFAVNDPGALAALNDIADAGGTTAALIASDRQQLIDALGGVLDRVASGNTTRSQPAFVNSPSTVAGDNSVQMEFNAGFNVSGPASETWSGILERTRYLCDGANVPQQEDASSRVRFHEVLNARVDPRRLWTVLTTDPNDMDGNIVGDPSAQPDLDDAAEPYSVVTVDPAPVDFDDSIAPEYFGIPTLATGETRRDSIVEWVHAENNSRTERLGDIYHSSPVAIGAPQVDIADESYNLFRRKVGVADRPTVVYVGTNDGILHAFVADDWTSADASESYDAGDELWGFVPPVLFDQLESATATHQVLLDGTPVVRDVFFSRAVGDAPSEDLYHTVLLMGFRAGSEGYFALDVTDPTAPTFLWQYIGQPTGSSTVTPQGESFGQPAMGQLVVEFAGSSSVERGVAILPGGSGDIDLGAAAANPSGCTRPSIPTTRNTTGVRARARCWESQGRVLTFVDIATGRVIREFDDSTFPAPLNGAVSIYPGGAGSVAQRAFFTDADGLIWTADMSTRQPTSWEVRPFHDIFWNGAFDAGQPAYNAPAVSVDEQGQLIILQGTGDLDALDRLNDNRIASVTEQVSFSSAGVPSYESALNWELLLANGEQVTGSIELFEGNAYFATFESAADPLDYCALGQGRIWGVDYAAGGGTVPSGYSDPLGGYFPVGAFEEPPGSGTLVPFQGPYGDRLVLGVGITQRPTCVTGSTVPDAFLGSRYQATSVGGGTFQLTAQLSGGDSSSTAGAIETRTRQLESPVSYTRVQSFAGAVDY